MKLVEVAPGLSVAAQPTEADIRALAASGVKTLINNRPDGEEPGQLDTATARAAAEAAGMNYIEQPVTGATIDRAAVEHFSNLLEASSGPIVAHCRSGTRCYTLWAAGRVLRDGADPERLIEEAAAKGFDLSGLRGIAGRLGQP
jgi:uncharacterized protein (TIGR01244 family)